ncbi:hypothetical protein D3C87_1413230 [compost metagenome]
MIRISRIVDTCQHHKVMVIFQTEIILQHLINHQLPGVSGVVCFLALGGRLYLISRSAFSHEQLLIIVYQIRKRRLKMQSFDDGQITRNP